MGGRAASGAPEGGAAGNQPSPLEPPWGLVQLLLELLDRDESWVVASLLSRRVGGGGLRTGLRTGAEHVGAAARGGDGGVRVASRGRGGGGASTSAAAGTGPEAVRRTGGVVAAGE